MPTLHLPAFHRSIGFLLIALLLGLAPAGAQAKLRFGDVERIRHVADTTLTDASGAKLYLGRKVVERHFLLPYSIDDQGFVLGVSGDGKAYYRMPEGEALAGLQRAGHLPAPLPPFALDTLDLALGHALWLLLLGMALYLGVPWAWRRLRGSRATVEDAQEEPAFAATSPDLAEPAPPAEPAPLPVVLPLRLQPRRLKNLGFLAICLGFVAIGVMMFEEQPVMGALCAGFFGLGVPVFIVQLLPGASYLELTADRFVFRSLFKRHSVRWRDIASLHVVTVQGRVMVGWNHVAGFAGRRHTHSLSKSISGVDAALPDTYGLGAIALAQLMDHIREHAHRSPA